MMIMAETGMLLRSSFYAASAALQLRQKTEIQPVVDLFHPDGSALAGRLYRSHALLPDLLHASQRLLDLGTTGYLAGCEFVPAQPTGQIRPKVKFPQPDLEHLLAVGTGQFDPCAPKIFEHAAFSG
jgi:hypothetical protein